MDSIYVILKSFSLVSGIHREIDIQKIYLKLQNRVIDLAPELDVNTICKILRLYADHEIASSLIFEEA